MANPWAGEVEVTLDGVGHRAKLTLGALAELEVELQAATMVDLVKRFEAGALSARDVLAVIVAGLRGGGWSGRAEDLMTVEIGDSPFAAARLAGELIARAFALPAAGPGG